MWTYAVVASVLATTYVVVSMIYLRRAGAALRRARALEREVTRDLELLEDRIRRPEPPGPTIWFQRPGDRGGQRR